MIHDNAANHDFMRHVIVLDESQTDATRLDRRGCEERERERERKIDTY
jgi:hypothetical protein